jgi:hypothetical protein
MTIRKKTERKLNKPRLKIKQSMVICGLINSLITHLRSLKLLFSTEKIRAYIVQESENQILKV